MGNAKWGQSFAVCQRLASTMLLASVAALGMVGSFGSAFYDDEGRTSCLSLCFRKCHDQRISATFVRDSCRNNVLAGSTFWA